jgi:hypothetical protein
MATLVFYLEDGSSLTHHLEEGVTTIGRHPDSVVVLEFPSVSGHHAVLEWSEQGCRVVDQQSSNGTQVNGVRIEEAFLKSGDRLAFGNVQAVYDAGDSENLAAAPGPSYEEVPQPIVAAQEAPPPLPAHYRPPAVKPNKAVRQITRNYPDTRAGGCAVVVMVTLVFIAALFVGLYLRHAQETNGSNFFTDVYERLKRKPQKVQVEEAAEKP